jgi:hypothetical protein
MKASELFSDDAHQVLGLGAWQLLAMYSSCTTSLQVTGALASSDARYHAANETCKPEDAEVHTE